MRRRNGTIRLLFLLPWLALLVLLPLFPKESMDAAIKGIAIWWEVLFPALLPFFVIAELLLGFGFVHFIGCLFDPMMRPVFRVPGYGGFVMAMGFASGYPIGARLTSQLREGRLVDRDEGERLVAFTSTSDPIFLIGAVSVGFFHDAGLAVVLAAAHYGGSVIIGLGMRYHGRKPPRAQAPPDRDRAPILVRALNAMHEARRADSRSFGQLLQEAVQTGLKLVFMIGALVVFISVLLELLSVTRLLDVMSAAVGATLGLLRLPAELSPAIVSGLFEVTLGAQAAGGAASTVPLVHKVGAAVFVLSWAGLSVHAQIVSLLTQTDLRYAPFALARLLHGGIATLLVYLLWAPLDPLRIAVSQAVPAAGFGGWTALRYGYGIAAGVFFAALLLVPMLYLVYAAFRRLRPPEH